MSTYKNAPGKATEGITEDENTQDRRQTDMPTANPKTSYPEAFLTDMDLTQDGDRYIKGSHWEDFGEAGVPMAAGDLRAYYQAWSDDTRIEPVTWETPIGTLLTAPATVSRKKEVDYSYIKPTDPEYRALIKQAETFGRYLTMSEGAIKALCERENGSLSGSNFDRILDFRQEVDDLLKAKGSCTSNALFDLWAATEFQGKGHRSGGYYVNALTRNVEKENQLVDLDHLYSFSYVPFAKDLGRLHSSAPEFETLCLAELKNHVENPWANAFKTMAPVSPEAFQEKHGFDPHRMAEFITGETRDLPNKLWRIHETAAIGRFLEPGFDVQSMLVLISEVKGLHKTRFLRAKTGPLGDSYFLQSRVLSGEKEVVEKFRGKTILCIDECDRAFSGAHGADLKEFITNDKDNYRAPYARTARDYPRSVVCYATTNTPHLLQDHAGDRRFFIIHCRKELSEDWMTQNWADYHGFYVWCFQQAMSGNPDYRHYLSSEENREVEQYQSEYKTREPWMDALDGVLDHLEEKYGPIAVMPSDLLAVLGKEIPQKRRWTTQTIKDILTTERGYKIGRPKLDNGKGKQIQKGKPHPYQESTDKPTFMPRMRIEEAYQAYIAGN